MAIPDRLNPRVWLRNWLNKPTESERAASDALIEWRDRTMERVHGKLAPAVSEGAAAFEVIAEVRRILGTDVRRSEAGGSCPSDSDRTRRPQSRD